MAKLATFTSTNTKAHTHTQAHDSRSFYLLPSLPQPTKQPVVDDHVVRFLLLLYFFKPPYTFLLSCSCSCSRVLSCSLGLLFDEKADDEEKE